MPGLGDRAGRRATGPLCARRRAALCAALIVVAAGFAASAGEEEAQPGWSHVLAGELMSPYCPGRALPDCPSPQASELREWIIVQEREGRSQGDVMAQLLARFGEGLLQKPRARGFGLTAYGMPIAGVLVGGILLFVFFRRQAARAAAAGSEARGAPLDPDLERRVEEEFRRAKEGA